MDTEALSDDVEEAKELSQLEDPAVYNKLKDWYVADDEHSTQWRKRAYENFDFIAGRQWSDDEVRILEQQKRPPLVFNRVLTIVKSIAGIEINSRHDVMYYPRSTEEGEVRANEILSAGSDWMADGCDAEDEQSEAFFDTMVAGMGWTDARLDYDEEPDGKYLEEKIDPLEMRWDKNARKKNVSDAKRLFRVRTMPIKDAMDMFPGVPHHKLNATWAANDYLTKDDKKTREEKRQRNENSTFYDPKAEVTIVHAQWIEKEEYYRVADPISGRVVSLSPEQFMQYQEQLTLQGIPMSEESYVKQRRNVYKQAFLGSEILTGVQDGPCEGHFSWNCITGERDRNEGTWFGLVDLMKDPQKFANKWLSQTMHILNTTAKGGILAEQDAFEDIREAQRTYAKPDAITVVAKGAIKDGKIMQKPGTGIAAPYVQLTEFAIASIRDTVGVSLELLGMRDVSQPGILEAHRKQAGLTILATLFDSLRRFRKRIGRVRLYYLQEYFSDGRLIRVTGKDGMEMMRLIKDRTLGKYDIEIDDAPSSPNQKERNWAIIQQIMPAFKEMMTPEAAIMVLEYSPLPAQLVQSFKSMLQEPPSPEQQMQQKIAQTNAQVEIDQKKAQTEKDLASAQKDRVSAILDMAEAEEKRTKTLRNASEQMAFDRQATIEDIMAQLKDTQEDAVIEPESNLPVPPVIAAIGEGI